MAKNLNPKNTILNYIENNIFSAIDGNDPFNFDVNYNERTKPTNAKNYPLIQSVTGEITNYMLRTGSLIRAGSDLNDLSKGWVCGFVGWIKRIDRSENLRKKLYKLEADMFKAFYDDYTLGGNCIAVSIIRSDISATGKDKNMGTLMLWLSINYEFDPKNMI